MLILEAPYISDELVHYARTEGVPVLRNDAVTGIATLPDTILKDSDTFKNLYGDKTRLYTTSENALAWIYDNIDDEALLQPIRLMKDKAAFRRLTAPLTPGFFFREATLDELKNLSPDTLKMPFVLKPSVGFFSIGVYSIFTLADWQRALANIEARRTSWEKDFPQSVVGNTTFILEEYIEGDEYAIDAYFNDDGAAVILNIMKHDFTSSSDVSDRLYYTSKEIIETQCAPFTRFLNAANRLIKARNFPAHIEVRVKDGAIVPIEFNPMRFAGWCTTDLVDFAFGIKTYDYYLNDRIPDWDSLLRGRDGKIYSLIILDKPQACPPVNAFDYDALCRRFGKVLCLRTLDYTRHPVFGFLFTETNAADRAELDAIIGNDLREFIR